MQDRLFIRAMCWRPVTDKTDPNKLDKRIERICIKLSERGRDPLTEMNRCATRLRECIASMKRHNRPRSRILTNKDPKRLGSLAWYEYMLGQVEQIIGILVTRRLESMLMRDIAELSE